MTDNFKKYLWISGVIAVFLLALAAWGLVDAYSKSIEPSAFRSFNVTGEGRITAIPDVAAFSFSVITEGGRDLAALQSQNTGKANGAIEFVKSKGVGSKDIRTSGYSVEPRYQNQFCNPDRANCPPPEIVGYTVSQTLAVKMRDFSKVGEVLSGVVGEGANSVSGLSFTVDDPAGVQNEARAKAIQNAKERAKVIAKAGNFRIGRLLGIEDQNSFYPVLERAALNVDSQAAATPPVLEPGSQEVTVQVVLKYEID